MASDLEGAIRRVVGGAIRAALERYIRSPNSPLELGPADPGSRSHGSVEIQRSLRGKVRLTPRWVLPAFPCIDQLASTSTAFVALDPAIAPLVLVVPVERATEGSRLEQRVREGWHRRLSLDPDRAASTLLFPPVLISARDRWSCSGTDVEVFDRAIVVDGACRLEAALRRELGSPIPSIVVFGLSETDELSLRNELANQSLAHSDPGETSRFGTTTQRLEISDRWVEVVVESEPFIVPTRRGYAPALLVRRSKMPQREHILIGAQSLGRALEDLRLRRGRLTGERMRIRKSGREATAPYEIQELA